MPRAIFQGHGKMRKTISIQHKHWYVKPNIVYITAFSAYSKQQKKSFYN